jgi:hypothetical protein
VKIISPEEVINKAEETEEGILGGKETSFAQDQKMRHSFLYYAVLISWEL